MKTIARALTLVFEKKRYLALALILTALGGIFLYTATLIPGQNLDSWLFSTPAHVKFLVVFGALMLGLIGSVQWFSWRRLRSIKKRSTLTSAGAIGSTLLATACCSPFLLPLAGVLGFGGTLFFFQTHQLPIVLLSFVSLLVALHYSCKAVDCKECRAKIGIWETK